MDMMVRKKYLDLVSGLYHDASLKPKGTMCCALDINSIHSSQPLKRHTREKFLCLSFFYTTRFAATNSYQIELAQGHQFGYWGN